MPDLEDAKHFVEEKNLATHCKNCAMGIAGLVCCGGVFFGTVLLFAYIQHAGFQNANNAP
jgi:hypothetical protein